MANDSQGSALEAALERLLRSARRTYDVLDEMDASQLDVRSWQAHAARLGVVLSELDSAAKTVNRHFGLSSPQTRILEYLKAHVGETVSKDELRGVAAIYEWARRVRELRVEHGWPISTNTNRPDLRPGQYVLEAAVPDEQLARRWRLAKEVRNRKMSGKDSALAYLQAIFPESADADQLAYVCKIKSYARRIRELDEEGWRIQSNVDNSALAPGSYTLLSLERRPPRSREAIKRRYEILDRDGNRCATCGASPEKDQVTLQVHHVVWVSNSGTNDPENLITLCSNCHAGRHSVEGGSTRDELLEPGAEQRYGASAAE